MLPNLAIVLPIFALILAGWLARRSNALGPDATREVNRLVVYLALPALLFDIMANASPAEIWQPGFIFAFSAGCAAVFGITLLVRMRRGRRLADAAIDGLNAAYPNTGYVGFPLVLAVIGPDGLAATLLATILTACVLFGVAIVLIESALHSGMRRRDIARRTLSALVRNPLLLAPAVGALVMLSGWPVPKPLETFLDLLGGAASPCALVALGLFLADNAGRRPEEGRSAELLLVVLKLAVQPAVTWLVAVPLLGLPATAAQTAVLLSALPTGTGPFMLAAFYGRDALLTARVVVATTVLSVLTLSLYLAASQ
ncbi:AEC family transporter [Rhodobacteraceae bacterium DSL-40]|uniref:AEC family transporter n=1 Tax=Amaricoccus sp. B4 TaxID=3368557 RepID=UPI000DAEB7E7